MSAIPKPAATYEDLLAIPEKVKAEILYGEIHTFPSPSPEHQGISGRLGGFYGMQFDWGRGGPGGWWIIPDVDVQLDVRDVVRPDLSGWRKERVPSYPRGRPIRLVPDWICEITSPSNTRHDRLVKADLYLKFEVPFYWLVDPAERILEALGLEGARWVRLGAWGDGDTARIPPFDAVEIEIAALFPPPPEEPAKNP